MGPTERAEDEEAKENEKERETQEERCLQPKCRNYIININATKRN